MALPLTGCTVGVTGDRRWEEQVELLERRGAQVVHGPVMRTALLSDADLALAATREALDGPMDVVVLTTGIGTRSWFGVAEGAGLDQRLRDACGRAIVLARGPKARAAALAGGIDVHWSAPGETSAEVLERVRALAVAGQRVVVQRDGGEPTLAAAIADLGAEVVDVPVYRWHLPTDPGPATRVLDLAAAGRLDVLTFTCAYAVGSAFALARDADGLRDALRGPVLPVAVGPVTAAALRAHGVEQVVTPARARLGAMVQALVTATTARHRVLRVGDRAVRWQGSALVHDDGSTAVLTAAEARVLRELVASAPSVVPKRSLTETGVDDHAAEVAVGRLRAKLGPLATGIRTVPRRGYACALEVGPAAGAAGP